MPLQEGPKLEGHLAGDAVEKHMRAPVARDPYGQLVWERADLLRARDAEGQMREFLDPQARGCAGESSAQKAQGRWSHPGSILRRLEPTRGLERPE